MHASPDPAALFDASPNPYMVLDRELRYVAANRAYLQVTTRRREELIGRRVTDIFPHDPADPNNENARRLVASFERVFATGEPDVLPLIHYRILARRPDGDAYEDHHWSATHTPLFDAEGRVEFVLQHTVDVTDLQRQKRSLAPDVVVDAAPSAQVEAGVLGRAEQVQQRNDALTQDLRRLLQVFEQAPGFLCFLRGPEHVFELANAAYERLVGRRELLGRRVRDVLPEVGEGYFELLDRVFESGEAFVGRAMRVPLKHALGGPLREAVVDFVYQPVRDAQGDTQGVLVVGNEITEQKRAETEALQLAKVLDATRDFVGIADLGARTPTFANAAALRLVGLPDMEAARRVPVEGYFVERERERVTTEVLPTALRDGYWEGELHFRNFQTGEEVPVRYSVFPLRDGAGAVTSLATITRDLRAQKAAEAERAELLQKEKDARAQAEQANQLKDLFLATVSHELRTPLTSILGWMQMLKSGMLPPEKHARALDTIERNARVQAQLIDDLLDVSRIISGKLALEVEPAEIAAVVGAAAETVRPVAEARGVHLEVLLDSTGVVMGDARRLQQVVWNLLSNAVKFTPKDGRVLLQVERRGDAVEVAVSDTGAGIAPDFLPHVFERFRQAEGGPARKLGGLGLGLSIVRHVVEAHGGEARAFSAGEGKGATFTVRLPLSPSLRVPLRAPVDAQGIEAPPALEGLHVLVVDDEEDSREYVRTLLQQCKARVTTAASAAEAMDAFLRERPDAMVSDIAMPGEDGYRLIQRVRALPDAQAARTPAVALTAHARLEDRTRAMRAGFHNHVTKPVEPAELLAVLAALVSRREG